MEERRFDELTRRLAGPTSRRNVLKGLITGIAASAMGALGSHASAQGNSDAAHFCSAVFPPGPARGKCTSDAAHGTGLYYQCQGNQANVCQGANGPTCPDFASDSNNCGQCGNACEPGIACLNGTCGCPEHYQYCAHDDTCYHDNCIINPGYHIVFDPTTCGCVCMPGYIELPGGGCAVPCTSDTDCVDVPYADHCGTTAGGMHVCANSGVLTYCTPCETDADCYNGCFAVSAFCEDHQCRVGV